MFYEKLNQLISQNGETEGTEFLWLPTELEGHSLIWKDKESHLPLQVLAIGMIVVMLLPALEAEREKEARKNQRVVEIKEVRMSPSIDVNDFNVKMRNAQKFLSEGNRVKVTVRFRGREMAHTDIGQDLLVKFAEGCNETAVLDKEPKLEGRHMSIFLSPKPAKETKK